jgi:hypothetical protein
MMFYQLNGIYDVIMMSGRIKKLCGLKIKSLCAIGLIFRARKAQKGAKNLGFN